MPPRKVSRPSSRMFVQCHTTLAFSLTQRVQRCAPQTASRPLPTCMVINGSISISVLSNQYGSCCHVMKYIPLNKCTVVVVDQVNAGTAKMLKTTSSKGDIFGILQLYLAFYSLIVGIQVGLACAYLFRTKCQQIAIFKCDTLKLEIPQID